MRLCVNLIDTKIFYIKEIKSNRYVASNLIYDIELYTDNKYNFHDLILINSDRKVNDKDKFASNIYYTYYDDSSNKLINSTSLKSYLFDNFKKLPDNEYKNFIGQVIFEYKDYDNAYYKDIVSNLSPYYFLIVLNKLFKNFKFRNILKSIFLVTLFGLSYSVLRVLIFEFFKSRYKDKSLALSYSIYITLLLNPHAIYSYSFVIPIILRIMLYIKNDFSFKMLLTLIQSYFFYETNIINILFYKLIMFINLITKIILMFQLGIKINLFTNIFYELSNLINYINKFSFKGQISLFFIVLLYLFIKYFKIKNNALKWLITLLFISSNISNIFASVSFIDVGQGDAILIREPFNKNNILIDTGSKYNYYKLNRFLKKKGIYELNYLIISHLDSDHSDNVVDLIKDFNILNINYNHQDIKINNVYLKSLNNKKYDDKNDNSLVYFLSYNDLEFLLTGDISKIVEEEIVKKNPNLKVDILKLSHHGSKTGTSDYLLMNYNVKIAIASTSGAYNHPHIETIERLNKWKIPLYKTNESGNIDFILTNLFNIIITDGGEFVIIR